jgi:hypothetical protein
MLLFCGFGVLSGLDPTSVAALALGSFAVASAIFMILELGHPYTGLFRIPAGSMEQTLAALKSLPTHTSSEPPRSARQSAQIAN